MVAPHEFAILTKHCIRSRDDFITDSMRCHNRKEYTDKFETDWDLKFEQYLSVSYIYIYYGNNTVIGVLLWKSTLFIPSSQFGSKEVGIIGAVITNSLTMQIFVKTLTGKA